MSVMTITEQQVIDIIDDTETSTDSVDAICARHSTNKKAFYKILHSNKNLTDKYIDAKRNQVMDLVFEIPDIERRTRKEMYECDPKMAMAIVQQGRTETDTRKWLGAKLVPKLFGDRLDLQVATEHVTREILIGTASTSMPKLPEHKQLQQLPDKQDEQVTTDI